MSQSPETFSAKEGWIAMFNEYDKNEDGTLCREELKEVMQLCGTNPTDGDIDEYIAHADTNVDGVIDCDEFCIFMEKQFLQGDPKDILREAFRSYVEDDAESISPEDMRELLNNCEIDQELIDELVWMADNNDRRISLDEFVNLMVGHAS